MSKPMKLSVLCYGLALTAAQATDAPSFELPVNCAMGETCFVQQYADMDETTGARDPFCEAATYDGHKGTDFRVPSWTDAQVGVDVVAAYGGTVRAIRDGVADRIMRSVQDRQAVDGIECGNGVVITHDNGWETQYCHLKQGSVSVAQGQTIEAGSIIGQIGASGSAEFPHVHFSVRQNGSDIDPFSAERLDGQAGQCITRAALSNSLWSESALADLAAPALQLIGSGLTNSAVDHGRLTDTKPVDVSTEDTTLVGWAWLINLQQGDEIALLLTAPDGTTFAQTQTQPLDANKADYSLFAGRRRPPMPGTYMLSVSVLRDGEEVLSTQQAHTVR